jgi:hypothetical protein
LRPISPGCRERSGARSTVELVITADSEWAQSRNVLARATRRPIIKGSAAPGTRRIQLPNATSVGKRDAAVRALVRSYRAPLWRANTREKRASLAKPQVRAAEARKTAFSDNRRSVRAIAGQEGSAALFEFIPPPSVRLRPVPALAARRRG